MTAEPGTLLQCCDVLVITATDRETNALKAALAGVSSAEEQPLHGKRQTYVDHGVIAGARVLRVRTEMGSGTSGGSASTVSDAITEVAPRAIIMVGIAFGAKAKKKQQIGTVLISQQLQDYELQRVGTAEDGSRLLLPRGDKVSASPRLIDRLRHAKESWSQHPVEFGLVLSGEKLIDDTNFLGSLKELFPEAIGGEMEGRGLYVEAKDRAEWIVVKAVCDWADGNKRKNKARNQRKAAQAAAGLVVHALGLGGFDSRRDGGGIATDKAYDESSGARRMSSPSVQHGGVSIVDQAQVRAGGHIVGRDLHVTINNADSSNNNSAPKSPEPRTAVDLKAYLKVLLAHVEHIEIAGISSRPGRSEEAIFRPIEELYTPLTTVSHRSVDKQRGRGGSSATAGPRSVALPEVLPEHRRLLLIGQPGSGKTTFLNLVACMLARDLLDPARRPTWREEHLGLDSSEPAKIPGLIRMSTLAILLRERGTSGRLDDRRWLCDVLALQHATKRAQILDVLADPGHEGRAAQWERWLTTGEAVLLVDGLDEVADRELRARVLRIFQDACDAWKESRIIVTSRPIHTDLLTTIGFHPVTIAPFGRSEIARFVHQWAAALPRGEEREASLSAALRERRDLRRFAETPVMLTCLCVLHWNEGQIPEGRARVYRAVFTWMLGARKKLREAAGFTAAFAEEAFTTLALAMMTRPEGKVASIEIAEAAELLDSVVKAHAERIGLPRNARRRERLRHAEGWLVRECEWSHIVKEESGDVLRFWHLTIQEHLAALGLAFGSEAERAEDVDVDEEGAPWWPIVRARLDDHQWRETVDLFPGCLCDEGGGRRKVSLLLRRVLDEADADDLASEACIVGVVGRLLATLTVYDYPLPTKLAAKYDAMRARVMAIFTREGAEKVSVDARIAAAEALGRAGDPRFAEGVDNFVEVPWLQVKMGRYPVTVGEFARFVDDEEGYMRREHWDEAGWASRMESGREAPSSWEEQLAHRTRPVTGVEWWDARAYCRWRTAQLGQTVRLPLEEEWRTVASNGGRLRFPWGDAPPSEEHANYAQNFGAPTPVGIYPAGSLCLESGDLIADLSGNVDEWCDDGPEREEDQRWMKGGSWCDSESGALAAAYRGRFWGWFGSDDVNGFRVVLLPASS